MEYENDLAIPVNLRCEHHVEPIGIDVTVLRFSWENPKSIQTQKRYRILIESIGGELLWDSGETAREEPWVVFDGEKLLKSYSQYRWKVALWDEENRFTGYSTPSSFETAAITPETLPDSWITAPKVSSYHAGNWESGIPEVKNSSEEALHYHGIYLRTQLVLDKPVSQVVRSRFYGTGVGLYILEINGQKVGEHLLSPAQTDYHKRVLYDVLTLDDHLQQENLVTLIVGNGRHIALYGFERPRAVGYIRIEYHDGSIQELSTDESWDCFRGPITENSLFDGETYDATLTPTFLSKAVRVEGYPLFNSMLPPIMIDRRVVPKSMKRSRRGFILDFGQNLSGFPQIKINQPRGTRITLRHAEMISNDGELNPASNRAAKAEDIYICSGEKDELWSPSFTYHGFRYIEVSGYIGELPEEAITALFIHTETEFAGTFSCSNEDLNTVHEAIRWGQLSNLMGIPTDSPQRDERHGWLGDAHLAVEEALLNFMPVAFYQKFIQDIADTQREDGSITDVAPKFWMEKPADPAWGSALISISWAIYWYSGDRSVLEKYFSVFEEYIAFLQTQTEDGIIEELGTFGDWCAPGLVTSKKTGLPCISTWYYLHDVSLLSQISSEIGEDEKSIQYKTLADTIKNCFLKRFYEDGIIKSQEMTPWDSPDITSQVLALEGNLLTGRAHDELADSLNDLVTRYGGNHVNTGIHGTKYLLKVLCESGFEEKAYLLANQESYPGWIYMIRNGATTLWERWELIECEGMNSHNHIMLGSVDSWFYHYVAGILPLEAGWRRIGLNPGFFSDISHAEASVSTPYGKASLSWKRQEHNLKLNISIPSGTLGELHLPDGHKLEPHGEGIKRNLSKIPWRGCDHYMLYTLTSGSYELVAERI